MYSAIYDILQYTYLITLLIFVFSLILQKFLVIHAFLNFDLPRSIFLVRWVSIKINIYVIIDKLLSLSKYS